MMKFVETFLYITYKTLRILIVFFLTSFTMINSSNRFYENNHVTNEQVKTIVANFLNTNDEIVVDKYSIRKASEKMLGFLCDYWKLDVTLAPNNQVIHFFIKAICRSNAAKTDMIKELKLFEKELVFYSVIKRKIEVPGLQPWSARLITTLDDAMVFEDLNALQYKLRNKFERFDMPHTIQALKSLARFHASSIIFEEKRSKMLNRTYRLNEDFAPYLKKSGYHESSVWFLQCIDGALQAVRTYSKFNDKDMKLVEASWRSVWLSALCLSSFSAKHRNVICHRDLWNNNILFHYDNDSNNKPDDCVFVDFQAIRYQPPAGDIMALLCCNLDPTFREENLYTFLNCYLDELQKILLENCILLENIIDREEFFASAAKQRLWGLVVCGCLIPQFWIDDDLTTEIFCDTEQFDDIMTKNKGMFIMKFMATNPDYKEKVLEIFEEIARRYCL